MEERLRFYEDGVAPTKNLTAMQDALRTIAEAAAPMEDDGAADAGAAEEGQPKKGKVRQRLVRVMIAVRVRARARARV